MKRALLLVALLAFPPAGMSDTHASTGEERKRTVRAVVWRDPRPIAGKDLFWGPGTLDSAPRPPYTFVEEDTGGTRPKVIVTDANGTTWNVKFTGSSSGKNEVHAEVAATRLAWAFGFPVEETYYVPEGTIQKVKPLGRSSKSVDPDGIFRTARFEKRPPNVLRQGGGWSLDDNPFLDTYELSALKILLVLLNNWDTKSSNFSILQANLPDREPEDLYVMSDYGATFGRMGRPALFTSRNRWALRDYQSEPFIERVDEEYVYLHHDGDHPIRRVPLAHAQWFAELSAELSHDQIRRAFEASGASDDEIEGFSTRVMEKLQELQAAVAHAGEAIH